MDTKSMAKSKRSYTQHHQPKKPHQHGPKTLTTAPNPSTADPKSAEKKREDRVKLPSNWDRYKEVEEEEKVGPGSSGVESSRRSDVVSVKSKGADYGALVAEAKEKARGRTSGESSIEDALPDAYQGLGPLLAVRGENLVSWIGGDDFLPDETIPYQEPPFFSLNLDLLAERLGRIDLAKRLFIEDDLLPLELVNETKVDNHVPVHKPSATHCSSELVAPDSDKSEVIEDSFIGADTIDFHLNPSSSEQSSKFGEPVPLAKGNLLKERDHLDQNEASHVAVRKEIAPRFQAADAEAELDILLDSFSNMRFLDPSNISGGTGANLKEDVASTSASIGKSSISVAPAQSSAFQNLSRSAVSIDDTLDDLLNDTVGQTNRNTVSQSSEVKSLRDDLSSSSPHPGPKSKFLEDFDSWLDTI
ncbi:hypothetical protein Droror1_Dr00003129 [Drosera rotundifolia]